ncbi:MAG: hypothetical protein P0119_07720 [Nitrospira sp.]|nr:hypothetical protein [Nitrospira sp.]
MTDEPYQLERNHRGDSCGLSAMTPPAVGQMSSSTEESTVRVDVDFFSNPDGPTGTYYEPSVALRAAKEHFGSSPRARWFGL